jgi:hypothetical protein
MADDPHTLEQTRQFIRDFDRIDTGTTTAPASYMTRCSRAIRIA